MRYTIRCQRCGDVVVSFDTLSQTQAVMAVVRAHERKPHNSGEANDR